MDVLILYCVFSYLFMLGVEQEFVFKNDARGFLINLLAPLSLPVLLGKFIGNFLCYKGED